MIIIMQWILMMLARLSKACDLWRRFLGTRSWGFCESEAKARRNARRSIVTAVRIAQGDVITREMLTFKRPGTGISPQDIDEVIGRIALSDISEDTTVTREMIC